jgi:hypothetical protein
MNAQTLNRMIKASYYAPNGAQLRKACYGVMAVNSRRASVGAMSLEQVAELPKEEQFQVKGEIVKSALIQGSAEDQAKLANYGLKDIKIYLVQNGFEPDKLGKEVQHAHPDMVKAIKSEVKDLKGAVQVTAKVVKARSVEEILSFLDVPIQKFQNFYENIDWLKWNLILGGLNVMFMSLAAGSTVAGATGGIIILSALISVGIYALMSLVLVYFFGDILRWIHKRWAMIQGFIITLPFRVLSLALKLFGWGVDKFIGGIKDSWNKFFSRQASIAMQSPEFRRAYYNI